jgi:hypothetical protein
MVNERENKLHFSKEKDAASGMHRDERSGCPSPIFSLTIKDTSRCPIY